MHVNRADLPRAVASRLRHALLVTNDRSPEYRELIDAMVADCLTGQGQVGASRVRGGVWNANADSLSSGADQAAMNRLLADLSPNQREILASMLVEEFVAGMHQALVVLHEAGVEPFDDGYEGSPFHDFAGRLNGWSWPE